MKKYRFIVSTLVASRLLFFGNAFAEAGPVDATKAKSPALDMARQLNNAFIEVAERVSPAVVMITVVQKGTSRYHEDDESFWEMLPPNLRRYFEEQMPRERGRDNRRSLPEQRPTGRGSGIIITEDGYILTNNHVVEDAEKITVRFKDSREFPAEVKGRDPQSDLAVIKIDGKGLTYAKLGDSSAARVGEFVIAIGAPFDLDYSVTVGHISAKGRAFREFGAYADQDFIQTDASINPGNSGGPLVNLYGEVIGINTMIRGIGTGIGFAVPSNIARNVTDHLIREGKFTRSRIGVEIRDLRDYQEYSSQLKGVDDGVIINSVLPDGPAAKSDLKAGDIVTAVDGRAVKTSRELKEQIAYKKPGEAVTLDVVRVDASNKTRTVKVKVKTEAMPAEEEAGTTPKKRGARTDATDQAENFGMTLKSITPDLADEYGLDVKQGVLVAEVEPGSVADEKGISPGDVITEVNRTPVSNLRQLRETLKNADKNRGIIINYVSKGTSRFTVLKEK